MKKLVTGLSCAVMLVVQGLIGVPVFAEGPDDVPSASYIDEENLEQKMEMELQSLSREYARAFSCNGRSSWTSGPWSEQEGYNWIVDRGAKDYIQEGASGGTTLGVFE